MISWGKIKSVEIEDLLDRGMAVGPKLWIMVPTWDFDSFALTCVVLWSWFWFYSCVNGLVEAFSANE